MDGSKRDAQLESVVDAEQAVVAGVLQLAQDGLLVGFFLAVGPQSVAADLERLTSFLQRFLEGTSDAHRFADGLHLQTKVHVGSHKFSEVPARNLHDHVVQGRLEEGRGGAGDLVLEFV